MPERISHPQRQTKQLIVLFFTWKCVLFLVSACSPGLGYDTSALILVDSSQQRHSKPSSMSRLDRFAFNLFRWDALYFVKSAQREYVYEQEWAFSWAYSALLKMIVRCEASCTFFHHHPTKILEAVSRTIDPPLLHFIWTGIAVSNISHLFSVLILFKLSNVLLGDKHGGPVPLTACVLHILSPAGLFLSAPYGEALFAALNFSGMLCYVQARVAARLSKSWTWHQDAGILGSAILFGLATFIRSNGLLSGLVFLFDVVGSSKSILGMRLGSNDTRRVIVTLVGGMLLGIMSVVPQYVAYKEYCTTSKNLESRPWCHRMVPSIYTWVQSEYWLVGSVRLRNVLTSIRNVGFLRYWTLPNLPLFLIAAPMLWLLFQSSVTFLCASHQHSSRNTNQILTDKKEKNQPPDTVNSNLPQLALPQLILALAAATSFHVQIVNRISSGYPIWYLTVAQWMTARETTQYTTKRDLTSPLVVRGMIVYAIAQGVLFAGFLPPA
jgi:phosphatidylinositol glycan class V